MFYLPVTLWVCHRSVVDFDTEFFAPIFEIYACELSAIIHDNPVGDAESDHNVLEEFLYFGSCDRADRFGFNPLGEFVDGDEEMCKTTRCSLQRADYVKTPDCKWPSDRDSLQFLCRHVYLPSKILASLTFADDFVCVCNSNRPEETLLIGLADQCS